MWPQAAWKEASGEVSRACENILYGMGWSAEMRERAGEIGNNRRNIMSYTTVGKRSGALPISKWDARIRNNKRRRNAEIRRHIFLSIFAIIIICIMIFGINNMISKAGAAKEEELFFKYYKSICVEQGETLASIARAYADQAHYEDHNKYIQEVVYMNHLENADDIREGAYLIIPYYSNELK